MSVCHVFAYFDILFQIFFFSLKQLELEIPFQSFPIYFQVFLGASTCLLAFSAIPDTLTGGGEEGGGCRVGKRAMLVSALCFGLAIAIAISLIFISHQAGVAG